MGGVVDAVEGEGELARLKKFVEGAAAAGPGAIVVNGNEAVGHDSIVKRFETQFNGIVQSASMLRRAI
jgi:hypothetical protein